MSQFDYAQRQLDASSAMIGCAFDLATAAHADQTRKFDGKPYVLHPKAVAWHLLQARFPAFVVAAGMLHDVLEDTEVTPEILSKHCGLAVLGLVRTVTRPLPSDPGYTTYIEWIRSLPEHGPYTVAIKVFDICDNLRTLPDYQPHRTHPSRGAQGLRIRYCRALNILLPHFVLPEQDVMINTEYHG